MKLLIVVISAMAVVSTIMFTGAFQACTSHVADTSVVDDAVAQDDVILVTDTILVVPSDVLEEVTTEELDVVSVDVDLIEFTEEDTADMFD